MKENYPSICVYYPFFKGLSQSIFASSIKTLNEDSADTDHLIPEQSDQCLGTPNRTTKELREILKQIVFKEIEALPEVLDLFGAKDRMDLIIKLLHYTLPKVNNVNYDEDEGFVTDWS